MFSNLISCLYPGKNRLNILLEYRNSSNVIFDWMFISENLILIDFISHLCGVIFPVFTSFYGHKYITFNNSREWTLTVLKINSKNWIGKISKAI